MKKYIILFLFLGVILTGCTQNTSIKNNYEEAKADTDITNNLNEDSTISVGYKEWSTDPSTLDFFDSTSSQKDCLGVYSQYMSGGDLLSTIIAYNDMLPSFVQLEKYSIEYIKSLEKQIIDVTHNKYNADFYAFYICSLDADTDIATGYLWPKGKASRVESGKFEGQPFFDESTRVQEVLAIVHNNKVSIVDSVQTYNNTATGAETSPCKHTLSENQIIWSCFKGFAFEDEKNRSDYVIGSHIKEFTIDFNGNILETKKYIEFH